jgi:predicted NBD/HSP70 family sugar kinase
VTLVLCVDFGSTFTKAAVVDTANGRLIATANHPTLETRTGAGSRYAASFLGGYSTVRGGPWRLLDWKWLV